MKKNCSTCFYAGFGQCHFDDCKMGKNGIPTKWVPAPFWTPDTNADRIRAMSDDALCDFLYSYKFFEMCKEGCGECSYNGECVRRLAEWLEQPAEE